MRVWARNLHATYSLYIYFRGFGVVGALGPGSGWTLLSGVCTPTTAFPPGIRLATASASHPIDCLIWRPMIIIQQPDGSMVPSDASWGDAMPYLPTPTGSYIAGDTSLRRWSLGLRTAPSSGQAVQLQAYGRRLLWGRVIGYGARQMSTPTRLSMSCRIVGQEADGSET
jgi:hypothetical protein